MRREKLLILGASVCAAVAAFAAAPGAYAAGPKEICADLADNGRLDGTYSAEELTAASANASVQGYCTFVVVVPPTTVTTTPTTETTATGTAGTAATVTGTAVTPEQQPTALNSLPSGAVTPPVPVISPAVEQANPPAAGEVAGQEKTVTAKGQPQATARTTGVAGQQSPLRTTRTTGTLPFTGAELLLFAIVGGALLLAGMLLRTTAHQKARS